MELLPDWAPNLHPLIIHFPIAVTAIAVLFDFFSLILKKQNWLRYSALGLYILGALSAITAFITGKLAADMVKVPPAAYNTLSEHSDLALASIIVLIIYVMVRLILQFKQWDIKKPVAVLLLVAGAAGFVLIGITAEHGADLVFHHGVGVIPAETAKQNVSTGVESNQAEIPLFKDASWTLKGGPDISKTFRNNFKILTGNWHSIEFNYSSEDQGSLVLEIPVKENMIFVAGENLNNIQLTAEINLDKFNGHFSLIHHLQDSSNYDFLDIGNERLRLGRMQNGVMNIFDENEKEVKNWFSMKVVGSKGHFRGYINDQLVAHGHAHDLPEGFAGFSVQGSGSIFIKTLETISLYDSGHEGH